MCVRPRIWKSCAAAGGGICAVNGARNYLIGDRDLVRVEIVEHVKHHAQTHVRQRERAEQRNGS